VLCQPRPKPTVLNRKSAAVMPALAPKKATEKRRRTRGLLAKPLKSSKKFVLQSSGSSSAGGGSAAPALAHALDLFDLSSSASNAEPTDRVPHWKRP
jgi:hypothetical protein